MKIDNDFEIIYGKGIASNLQGTLALMCPKCYDLTYIDIEYNIKIKSKIYGHNISISRDPKIQMTCKNCHWYDDAILLDPNIAETISLLNKKGYTTEYCCEGHNGVKYNYDNEDYEVDTGYISFYENIDIDADSLPESWYLADGTDIPVIRSKKEYLDTYLDDIHEWAKSLPYL